MQHYLSLHRILNQKAIVCCEAASPRTCPTKDWTKPDISGASTDIHAPTKRPCSQLPSPRPLIAGVHLSPPLVIAGPHYSQQPWPSIIPVRALRDPLNCMRHPVVTRRGASPYSTAGAGISRRQVRDCMVYSRYRLSISASNIDHCLNTMQSTPNIHPQTHRPGVEVQ